MNKISKLLKLNHLEKNTAHSFRKTFVTLLVNTGVDVLALKRCGTKSITNKNEVVNKILYNEITPEKFCVVPYHHQYWQKKLRQKQFRVLPQHR